MHCHLQQGKFVCHVNYFWSEYSVLTIDIGKLIHRAFHIAGLFAVERVISLPCSIHWCHHLCSAQSGNKNCSLCRYWTWQITDNEFAVSPMLWCHHTQGPSGFRYSLFPTSARCCMSSWTWLVLAEACIRSWTVQTELLCSSICIIT